MKLPRTGLEPQRRRAPHRRGRLGQAGAHLDAAASTASPTRLHCFEDAGDKFVDKGDPRAEEPVGGRAARPHRRSRARRSLRQGQRQQDLSPRRRRPARSRT